MNKNKINNKFIGLIVISIIVLTAATTLCASLLDKNTSIMYKVYYENLKPGYIADDCVYVKTSIDVIDEEATKIARENARNNALPVFNFNSEETMSILANFEIEKETSGYSASVLSTAYDIIYKLCNNGVFDVSEVLKIKSMGYSQVVLENSFFDLSMNGKAVSINSLITTDQIPSFVDKELKSMSLLTTSDKNAVLALVLKCCKTNIAYDSFMTEQSQEKAYDNTQPVILKLNRGDVLIEKDKVIQQEQLDLIKKIEDSSNLSLKDILYNVSLILICLSIVFAFIYQYESKDKNHNAQYVGILLFFSILVVVATYFEMYLGSLLSVSFIFAFIPITFLPTLMTNVTGKKNIGIVSSFLIASFTAILPGASITTFFYCFLVAFTSVELSRFVHKRIDTLIQMLLLVVSSLAITAVAMFVAGYSFDSAKLVATVITINVIVSELAKLLFTPILEKIFNLPTVFRMHELAYSDSALLQRLYQAAPGTYNHSQQVATLAQNAAQEIHANDLIARVGALYHDIGKTDYPEYFVENQTGENKHEDINPSLSASIIKSHVKVGYDKGKEANLPKEVLHIIESHHGNDVISFFYHEALKEEDKDIQHVQSGDYAYNADIPETKECAIVMLADSIEAASRTIVDPTPAKYTKMINQIVNKKIERGQLNNCHLSMNNIEKIKQSFLNSLTAMNHSRIQYPDEETK